VGGWMRWVKKIGNKNMQKKLNIPPQWL